MKTVIWVHADMLSPSHPALRIEGGIAAVFVFDDALLEAMQVGLKRVVFLYECLLEMPVSIRRGVVADEVLAFAAEHQAVRIVTGGSVSPRFGAICDEIRKKLPMGSRLEVVNDEPFVAVEERLDLRRFSRYWQAVKRDVLGR